MEDYLREFRQQHGVDYYLMSIHFVTGWPEGEWTFAYPFGSGTIVRRYQDYFRTMQAGIRSGLFDAVAHFDLVKRPQYPVCDLVSELVDEVLDDLAAAGMAMEYNTSGLRKPIEETFPTWEVIRRAVARGVPICLGSDAHHPDQVGYAFETVPGLIEELPDLIPFRIRPGT
jgi:histidinol-phosphatase (PHP family)